jgi:hypothetical protein
VYVEKRRCSLSEGKEGEERARLIDHKEKETGVFVMLITRCFCALWTGKGRIFDCRLSGGGAAVYEKGASGAEYMRVFLCE